MVAEIDVRFQGAQKVVRILVHCFVSNMEEENVHLKDVLRATKDLDFA
jgi:hypothetical protein